METAKGISGLVLLPAKDYEWELRGKHTIEVPMEGEISSLLKPKEFHADYLGGEDEFCIYDSDDKTFLMWELVRVLFATAQYPSLAADEYFNIVAIENIIAGDAGGVVRIHGEVIKRVGV